MSSTSSDESDASAPRTRRSARLSADRGVIARASYAATSETVSDTDTEVDAAQDDDSDDVPLAQREEADESDEETEDEQAVVKQEPLSDEDGRAKIESVDEEHGDSTGSDDSENERESDDDDAEEDDGIGSDDDDDAISIKSEQEEEPTASVSEEDSDEDESAADESEYSGSDAEDVKSEEEDEVVAVAEAKASAADASSEDESVEEEDKGRSRATVGSRDRADDAEVAMLDREEEEGLVERDDGAVDVEEEEKEEEAYEDEGEADYEEEEDEGQAIPRSDMDAAKRLLDHIAHTHLPQSEQVALHKRKVITGPPMDYAISQADQWKRKYRWPVAMRNVRRRKFIANADELAADHQVRLVQPPSSASMTARSAFEAALAPTARPLMEAAVAAYREQNETRQRGMNFVDRLEETAEADPDAVDATRLRAQTRLGGHFTDQLLDSILVKNVLALQGIDASYAQQCWDPLPSSKRPIANWRFVLEHFCRTLTHGVDAASINSTPRLRKDTLIRIRNRLRTLYGVAWRSEDDAFFDLVDQQDIDPPEPSELIRL